MNSGSAYVFVGSEGVWTEQAELTVSGPTVYDVSFGASVDLDGDTVVVGGAFDVDQDAQTASSLTYVFVRNEGAWSEQDKMTVSDPDAFMVVGLSVGLDGDTVILGSVIYEPPGDDESFPVPVAVSAYVFARTGEVWTEQAELTVPDPEVNQNVRGYPCRH